MPRVRVYMACSFDGFIAGPDHDLSWLNADRSRDDDLPADPDALGFEAFMGQVGCLLMGRSTYDTVAGMGVGWPYGETPSLIATTRPLEPLAPSVQAAAGSIEELVFQAKALAGERDVYLDGGALVRQALNAGLVDEITATLVPVLLGDGIRLFDGLTCDHALQFTGHHPMANGMLQVRAQVTKD